MKSKTAERIQSETPEETKGKVGVLALKSLLLDKERHRDALDEEIRSLENQIWFLEHPETTYS